MYDDHAENLDAYLAAFAVTKRNPRNLPCPTCGEQNALTPAERKRGYQCDACAERAEGGGF